MEKLIITIISLMFALNVNSYQLPRNEKGEDIVEMLKSIDFTDSYNLVIDTYLSRKLAVKESNNRPDIINSIGCIGKYQFKESTLRHLGYEFSLHKFKAERLKHFSEVSQDEAMLKLLKTHRRLLKDVIEKYNGKVINGILITESGILAAAHLAGTGGVKKWFKHRYNSKDAYGTSVSKYLKEFSKI